MNLRPRNEASNALPVELAGHDLSRFLKTKCVSEGRLNLLFPPFSEGNSGTTSFFHLFPLLLLLLLPCDSALCGNHQSLQHLKYAARKEEGDADVGVGCVEVDEEEKRSKGRKKKPHFFSNCFLSQPLTLKRPLVIPLFASNSFAS